LEGGRTEQWVMVSTKMRIAGGVVRNMQEQRVESCIMLCGVRADLFAGFFWIFSHEKILTSGCVFVLLRCFAFEEAIQDCSRSRTELWCGLRMGRLGTVSSLCGLQLCIIALAEGDWDCVAVDGSC
jgi:hypothetical protein